ncbi:MAG: DUF5615 family PIN-like protein [Candidatus Riflebacteria bacterium]|nr:DUF5615 family PIN-like protein [Candidatus Riflebacteria bacterium]
MSRLRVYLDEDIHDALAVGLRGRGFDVLTTREAGQNDFSDERQLRLATDT